MKIKTPKVIIIGETTRDTLGMEELLNYLGCPEWDTSAFSDAEYISEVAGKLCYMSFATDLNDNLTKVGGRNNFTYIQEGIIQNKHGSVLEHSTVNIVLLDVSRILTHELVRHRVGSAYSQVSGRFVRSGIGMYIPRVIQKDPKLLRAFIEAAELVEERYNHLVQLSGVNDMASFAEKKEMTSALRRILPSGITNSILLTYNHRTFRHVIQERTSRHAEEEIRIAFVEVYKQLANRYPALYADACTEMVNGIMEVVFASHKV